MKTPGKRSAAKLLKLCHILLPLLITWGSSIAQVGNLTPKTKASKTPSLNSIAGKDADLFGTRTKYIENIGQYGDTLAKYGQMGKILYGYEGLSMPVLFTSKGLIHLQRKTKKPIIDRTITMEWVNANPDPQIITEGLCPDHFTYGLLKNKARAYKKIIYKELYPDVDLVYSFNENKQAGFEYSLVVRPGADISKLKIKYGGDVKSIMPDKDGNLIISSGIDEITVSAAVCYYAENDNQKISSSFRVNKNEISFKLPQNYTKERTLVIDPFVSSTGGLSGSDAGKAKDVDFDYAGNIYAVGGGDETIQKLSKYNASGALEWTFCGSFNIPCWDFGGSRGGWAVDKTNGKIYLGQGIADGGFRIICLDAEGSYDNYITEANRAFTQNWKMIWDCNGGSPKMYIAGGEGTGVESNSNIELLSFSPSSQTITPIHMTGSNTGNTDISDLVIDPASNDLYTIFSTSVLDFRLDNQIYKHKPPYTTDDISWMDSTGCHALHEPMNRPYLTGLDNSSNTIAVNSQYLFYWDGKNLKAFNKSDGSLASSPLVIPTNQLLMQGGIIADECNNVFVGSVNGTIKVFRFSGNSFDDDAVPDITIEGYSSRSVYDLVYDPEKKFLYAGGNGFIASFNISGYCGSPTTYAVNINPDCSSLSVTASVSPAPPAGSVITYNLFDGAIQIGSNHTGYFTGLIAEKNYRIAAIVNQSCSGIGTVKDFTISTQPLLKINTPAAICSGGTVDLTLAAITAGSVSGLTFTYWLDAAATIAFTTPTAATKGTYYIKGTNASGCIVIAPVVVVVLPAPKPNAGNDTVVCFGNNLQLNGSGGSVYAWAPATYLSNTKIANPVVTNPGSGNIIYRLKVKDSFGCESLVDDEVKITFAPPAKISITGDTMIAKNQPLQLNAIDINNSGFTDFLWSPAYGLNNPFVANPIAVLDKDMIYTLHASTADHCSDDALITIKVFRGPDIYVPNSFTPNGDGLNDVLKPIPVGLREFHYFNVFNRFGHLLFSTTNPLTGWDGKLQGKLQDNGTFVWIAEGIDFKGNIIQQKGYSTLIR